MTGAIRSPPRSLLTSGDRTRSGARACRILAMAKAARLHELSLAAGRRLLLRGSRQGDAKVDNEMKRDME